MLLKRSQHHKGNKNSIDKNLTDNNWQVKIEKKTEKEIQNSGYVVIYLTLLLRLKLTIVIIFTEWERDTIFIVN